MTLAPWLSTPWIALVGLSLAWGLVLAITALYAPLPSDLVSTGWLVLATFQALLIVRVVVADHPALPRPEARRLRLAWGALFFATALGFLGDLLWALAEDESPLADLVYLLEYPFWLLGLLFIPTEPRRSAITTRLIDALIVFVAASLVVWDLVLRLLASA